MTENETLKIEEQKPEKEKIGKSFIFSFFAFLFLITLPYNIGVLTKPDYMQFDGFHVFLFLIYTIVTCGFSMVYFNEYRTTNEQAYGKTGGKFITYLSTSIQRAFMTLIVMTIFYVYTSTAIYSGIEISNTGEIISRLSGYETFDLLYYSGSSFTILALSILLLFCAIEIFQGFIFSIAFIYLYSTDEKTFTALGSMFNQILECFSYSPLTMTAPIIFVVAITVIHSIIHRKYREDKALAKFKIEN